MASGTSMMLAYPAARKARDNRPERTPRAQMSATDRFVITDNLVPCGDKIVAAQAQRCG